MLGDEICSCQVVSGLKISSPSFRFPSECTNRFSPDSIGHQAYWNVGRERSLSATGRLEDGKEMNRVRSGLKSSLDVRDIYRVFQNLGAAV